MPLAIRRTARGKAYVKALRRVDRSPVLFVAVLLGGCTIHLGPLDENDEAEPPKSSVLPGPEQPQGDEEVLDNAQQARKDEADRYVAEVIYRGAPILRTIQLASGDIVDGIDRAMLPAIPYELPQLPGTLGELPAGGELGLTDVEQVPELAELVATAAPFYRPTFLPYILGETDATSIEDYLDRYQVGGAGARIKNPRQRAPNLVAPVEESQEVKPSPPGGPFSPLDKEIADDCIFVSEKGPILGRAWSQNVSERDCAVDDECGDGFCDRGRCAAIWTCRHRYGQHCVDGKTAPSRVGGHDGCYGLCLEGRCRSCTLDEECAKEYGSPDSGCNPGRERSGARRCGTAFVKDNPGGSSLH
jgi:hypothetical protein